MQTAFHKNSVQDRKEAAAIRNPLVDPDYYSRFNAGEPVGNLVKDWFEVRDQNLITTVGSNTGPVFTYTSSLPRYETKSFMAASI